MNLGVVYAVWIICIALGGFLGDGVGALVGLAIVPTMLGSGMLAIASWETAICRIREKRRNTKP